MELPRASLPVARAAALGPPACALILLRAAHNSLRYNGVTLTGAVPAGRRLAVAEGRGEGVQLLHR